MWTQLVSTLLAATLVFTPVTLIEDDNVYTHGSREERTIALTFDDGPHPTYTDRILDVLEKHNVKATFFAVGVNAENYPAPLLRAYEEGHEIGNHTYNHKSMRTMSYEDMLREVTDTAKRIYDLTDYGVNLIRPPQGAMSAQFLSLAEELGYRIVLWDVDTRDWAHEPVDKMVKNIMESTDNGDIILFHDYHPSVANTIKTLDIIIPALQEQGFRFVTVSELLS
ncbi:MAG: polysaccharide deacetylase family protein [Clostridia bacterium]|nr:polysaccharide deacetylase family protein [Clostridia bacterium]